MHRGAVHRGVRVLHILKYRQEECILCLVLSRINSCVKNCSACLFAANRAPVAAEWERMARVNTGHHVETREKRQNKMPCSFW